MRRVPSTQTLRAIESFARHGTVWQVAEELNLTRSAVSHQLRLLERDLDFQILNRVGTRIELTPRGLNFANDIRKALDVISSSAARNASQGVSGPITISCPPGFASSWLCRNIGSFREAYPDIAVSLTTPRILSDISSPQVDVFIIFCYENEYPAGADLKLLKQAEFTPLCSPAYLNRFDAFTDPRSLEHATLLHIDNYKDWEDWMRLKGLPIQIAQKGIIAADMNLIYASALASQGIAMGDEFVCRDALERGSLVAPFDQNLTTKSAYYLATSPGKEPKKVTSVFIDWVFDQLGKI